MERPTSNIERRNEKISVTSRSEGDWKSKVWLNRLRSSTRLGIVGLSGSVSEGPLNPYATPSESSMMDTGVNAEGIRVDDPTVLARWTIGLLVLLTIYDTIAHVSLTFDAGGRLGAIASLGWVETASAVLWIGYLVVFLCWMYRVMWNAKRVDPSNAKISPGYGVGSFFIPILNFWVPCLAMMQASRSTLGDAKAVQIWWITTMSVIAVGIIVVIVILVAPTEAQWTEEMIETADLDSEVTWFDHFVAFFDLVIAYLEVVMILPLTRKQREWSHGGATS